MFVRSFTSFLILLSFICYGNVVNADLTAVDCFEVPDDAILGDMNPANGGQGTITTSPGGMTWTAMANNTTDFTDIVTNVNPGQTGTTNVLNNVRGGTRKLAGSSLDSYGNIPGTTGNYSNNDATLCFWISPDNNGGDQIVFETGGVTDGLGIVLVGDGTNQFDLSLGVKDNNNIGVATVDLLALYNSASPDYTDFLKVTAEINLTGGAITLGVENLGTGLTSSTSVSYAGGDWTGGDGAGLFQVNAGLGADAALTPLRNGNSWQNFDGQFSGAKFFAGVAAVPEPGSGLLLAFAATGLMLRRRKR